jgi:hypothetical protein
VLLALVDAWHTKLRAAETGEPNAVVEIRSYNLKPGTRERFHQRFERFPSDEQRQRSEDAFYGSDEWKKGPSEAILADIDTYTTVVVRLDAAALRRLRARR